jgi:phospholipase D1/2
MTQDPSTPSLSPQRTANLICTPNGDAYQSYATDPVWVTKGDPYAMTEGNNVESLLSGEKYFSELAAAIGAAENSIYMLGWQINWDVELAKGVRLYDAFLKAIKAKPALKIYVLPWEGASQVPTYVEDTVLVLNSINDLIGSKRIFATLAAAHANPSAGLAIFFSHHQKQVVIDERIAFIGGIDVAYGRNDNATYSLNVASRQGTGNGTYNGCIPHLKSVTQSGYVNPTSINRPDTVYTRGGAIHNTVAKDAKKALHEGKSQFPEGGLELDASIQPRMPWQDVHLKIHGPAASDLASNFVLRWNSANTAPRLPLPPATMTYPKQGSCQVQMLRSASGPMVTLEAKSISKNELSRVHKKFWHNHIHHAMVSLIEKADHFIYIENQFFVSAFGNEQFGDGQRGAVSKSAAIDSVIGTGTEGWMTRRLSGDENALPSNLVCSALGEKLKSVIMNLGNPPPDGKTSPFHIYITLPVHSEGMLNNLSTMTQVHYTMQSLVYGTQSLINRTRRAILSRKLYEKGAADINSVFNNDNYDYESIPIEACWPYITLLNLRNWDQLGTRYVTEQIYVHTKMMVVDDRYALVGSANINDRSLLGDRDSEMAVLVMDTVDKLNDIGSLDGDQLTRKSARELRIGVWNKIFGNTGGKSKAGLVDAINRPAAQASWEAIRKVAQENTKIYESAFNFIPANNKSIWPAVIFKGKNRESGLMPFDNTFWAAPRHLPAAKILKEIQGYITLLPWLWTKGENNNSGYHSALFVNNETAPAATGSKTSFAAIAPSINTVEKTKEGVLG